MAFCMLRLIVNNTGLIYNILAKELRSPSDTSTNQRHHLDGRDLAS